MEGNSGMGIRKIDPLAKGAIAIGFNIFATMDIKLDCRISNRERGALWLAGRCDTKTTVAPSS